MYALVGIRCGVLRGIEILKKITNRLADKNEIITVSSILRSGDLDVNDESGHYVVVLKLATNVSPEEMVKYLMAIELDFFRNLQINDLQLILLAYDDQMSLVPELTLPHPNLVQKSDYLVAASEVWPNFLHPILQSTLKTLVVNRSVTHLDFVGHGRVLLDFG